ncbi:MAG: hypothetical protein KGH49_03460 [Candidatus Micrarchaeota archaeon]|nr:hypothetical protein [Candidatus Micrarchaeota archaeon]
MKVTHYPLSSGARAILVAALIINVIATGLFVSYSQSATAAGTFSDSLWILPAVFIGVFVLILLLLRFRYVLLERYPYLVNLPAFAYRLGIQTDPKRAGIVINRVFTVHTFASLYTSALYLVLSTSIIGQNSQFILHSILILVAIFILTVFIQYRRIYHSFANKK